MSGLLLLCFCFGSFISDLNDGFLLSATLVAVLGCLLRWHPRIRIRTSRVAPVRGGPDFSLQRQRKVGAAPHRGNASKPI
ncbi:hypothetical protein PSAB6_340257 [Paraburkholderia sabiae]|nr:hypothetical protein PSAB6_340257 [Paraburkholderia sabiae]